MFDELEKYKSTGHFFFMADSDLSEVCNAPKKGIGVFVIYELKNGRIDLVYIGSAGKIKQNGKKDSEASSLYDEIISKNCMEELENNP